MAAGAVEVMVAEGEDMEVEGEVDMEVGAVEVMVAEDMEEEVMEGLGIDMVDMTEGATAGDGDGDGIG